MTNQLNVKLYGITERQKEILAEAQLDADLTVAEIAHRAKLAEFTVRRNLDLLRQHGIIHKMWYLNPFANGYALYDVLLEIAPSFLPRLEKLLALLVRIPEVEFITELTGKFVLCVTVRGRGSQDIAHFIGKICAAYPGSICSKRISAILSLTDIPIFRSTRPSKRKNHLSFIAGSSRIELDTLDEQILSLMRSDPDISLTTLGRTLGIPATTITYRVRSLKERGAIIGARFFIDMFRLGYLFALHRLVLSDDGPANTETIESRLQSVPGVYCSTRSLGQWDICFGTATQNMHELSKCTAAITSLIGCKVSQLETVHVKRFYKLNGTNYKLT